MASGLKRLESKAEHTLVQLKFVRRFAQPGLIGMSDQRTHPTVLIAAVGLTVFSILGSAAITGLIPSAHQNSQQAQSRTVNDAGVNTSKLTEKAAHAMHSDKTNRLIAVDQVTETGINAATLAGLFTQKNVIQPLPMPNMQAASRLKIADRLGLGLQIGSKPSIGSVANGSLQVMASASVR